MSSFSEWERQQAIALRQKEDRDLDTIKCRKCGSDWFEKLEAQRYKAEHHVVLGQPVPSKPGSFAYIMLRCVRCNNLVEPRIVHSTRDIGGNDYNKFLDTLEGVGDKRPEDEQGDPKKPDEIPSQEL